MKLLNRSLIFLSLSLLPIVTIWAVVFYFNMLSEIKSSMDEGLENYKRLIIQNAQEDPTILTKTYFDESFFAVKKISQEEALGMKDQYLDTILFMQDADDQSPESEPVRMLITAFQMNGEFYELKVANSMVEEDDLIQELFYDVIWLYGCLLISIVLIYQVVLRRLWKPFYDLLSQLKGFRLGKSSSFPKISSRTREFHDLNSVVSDLLKHSTEVFEHQKQFIGNASHELQTPLAMMQSKLELFIEKGNLQESQFEDLAEVLNTLDRMIRLNRTLLLLTKIENAQDLENKQISINQVIKGVLDDLEDLASFKNVQMNLTEKGDLSVEMDASLASIIFSNLLKNAVFYNIPNGSVWIEVSEKNLKICNTGEEKSLDSEMLFTRFYKPKNQTEGTGLGLAIVKAISDLYGFDIAYTFENSLHCFQINFSNP